MPNHLLPEYEKELNQLKKTILDMGGLVEKMIAQAMQAVTDRDDSAIKAIVEKDREVDDKEIDINEQCVQILALRQPQASDLRLITIGLRIATDMERMGDLSVNISGHAKKLARKDPINIPEPITKMSPLVQRMVKESLDAFVLKDLALAQKVLDCDDQVDQWKWEAQETLIGLMKQDAKNVSRSLALLQIARHLERIADHATNIAEEVIFMVKGLDVRHGRGEE